MRKTLLQLLTFVLCITSMQNPLLAQEQTPLNQVVNTLKERISLSGYAQLGYTYDDAANPDNTFDIKRIIFMAHGKITKRWTCYSKCIPIISFSPDLRHVSVNSRFLIP